MSSPVFPLHAAYLYFQHCLTPLPLLILDFPFPTSVLLFLPMSFKYLLCVEGSFTAPTVGVWLSGRMHVWVHCWTDWCLHMQRPPRRCLVTFSVAPRLIALTHISTLNSGLTFLRLHWAGWPVTSQDLPVSDPKCWGFRHSLAFPWVWGLHS